MTECDLVKAIQVEAGALTTDAVENQLQHAKNLAALIGAYIILMKQ